METAALPVITASMAGVALYKRSIRGDQSAVTSTLSLSRSAA